MERTPKAMGSIVEIDSFHELGHEKTWIKGGPGIQSGGTPGTPQRGTFTSHLEESASHHVEFVSFDELEQEISKIKGVRESRLEKAHGTPQRGTFQSHREENASHHLQPEVNRQLGYRWENSQSKFETHVQQTHAEIVKEKQ